MKRWKEAENSNLCNIRYRRTPHESFLKKGLRPLLSGADYAGQVLIVKAYFGGRILVVQYKVPQNIDLEDKIIGPFTMRQFAYLMVAGFIIYGWWNYASQFVVPSPMTIFAPLALPVGLVAVAFTLVKVNDRPFEFFIANLFKYMFTPKKRMWREGYIPEAVIMVDKIVQKVEERIKTSDDLDSLAKNLEARSQEIIGKQGPAPQVRSAGETPSETKSINLSIRDVQSASEKQNQAQSGTPEPVTPATGKKVKTGGFMGFFGKK